MKNLEEVKSEKSNLKTEKSVIRNQVSPGRASEKWFDDILKDYYKRNASSVFRSVGEFLEAGAFFVTMTFSSSRVQREKIRLGLMNHDVSVEMDNFHRMYTAIGRKLLGGSFNNSRFEAQLPLAIVCIDYEGSRYATEIPASPKNVHIHAIWVVHPEHIVAFKKLVDSAWFKLKIQNGLHTDRVLFDPYVVQKARRGRLSGYVAKTWVRAGKNPNGAELIRIYPNSNYGGKPYRALNKFVTPNKTLERMRRIYRATAAKKSNEGEAAASELRKTPMKSLEEFRAEVNFFEKEFYRT